MHLMRVYVQRLSGKGYLPKMTDYYNIMYLYLKMDYKEKIDGLQCNRVELWDLDEK